MCIVKGPWDSSPRWDVPVCLLLLRRRAPWVPCPCRPSESLQRSRVTLDVAPVREDERGQGGAHGHEPQAHREERRALRCPETLFEVDLRDVLPHQRADRDPGEGCMTPAKMRAVLRIADTSPPPCPLPHARRALPSSLRPPSLGTSGTSPAPPPAPPPDRWHLPATGRGVYPKSAPILLAAKPLLLRSALVRLASDCFLLKSDLILLASD
jgi:hypothetical protein